MHVWWDFCPFIGFCNKNVKIAKTLNFTGKSIDFERHRTVPEKRMLLRVELDPSGYYPADWNLFE